MTFPQEVDTATLTAFKNLIEVVAKLRTPDEGCPWDLAQTQKSLLPYVIEEAYEVVDAIQREDQNAIAEELGDLLLQVILQAQIATEKDHFTLTEIAQGITQKLIRRHPHVFNKTEVKTVEEVRQNWEQIKAEEKGETPEQAARLSNKLGKYARTLPPLTASMKMSEKAAKSGFEWENINGVWAKFEEELSEFKEALLTEDKAHQQAELGDLLFTVVNLARWYDLDPSEALQGTNQRFTQRLSAMEDVAKTPLSEYTLEELETLWQEAKIKLKN